MKNIIQKKLFLLLILLSASNNLLAQDVSVLRHFGSSNPFVIGTPNDPVTVTEFCVFDNTYKQTIWGNTEKELYYDKTLMQVNTPSPNFCIKVERQNGLLHAFPITGCENDIIDAVSDDGIYKLFTLWRTNPTMGEVTEYLNDKIASLYSNNIEEKSQREAAALTLKNRYASSSVNAFERADQVIAILSQAGNSEEYQFADMITFSKNEDGSSIPFVALCAEENLFYRYDPVECNSHPYNLEQTIDGTTTAIDLN